MSDSGGSAGRKTARGGRRPRRANTSALIGWLLVIVLAAVIPYTIAKATHSSSKPTTVGGNTPSPAVPESSPASIAGASAPAGATAAPVTPTSSAAGGPPTGGASSTAPAAASGSAAPSAPTAGGSAGGTATTPEPPAAAQTYTVKAGDSLWTITKIRLGASATPAAINAGWQKIYDANRVAIGSDPSLLHPGEVLDISI